MSDSPAVILFDTNGIEVTVADGVAIPVNTRALLAAGTDGANARIILVDASGRPVVVGAGVAGTPAGGVVSIQGVASGTPVPISGSVTASNPSVGTNNSAIPASSTQVGGSDGTNLQAVRVFDADSGGGTQYVLGTILRKSASGGSVEAGTATDPLRIDPTGTTTQPVSGTVTSNQGTAAALSGAWPAQITDGTNGPVAVKPASTAAVATDPALVVAISPNNTIVTSNASVGVNNSAPPGSSTQMGGTDGTNLQAVRVFDADSGAGTQYILGVGLRKTASGGSVEAGTSSDPLRVDPTGTTTQPISGTVTANQGTPNSLANRWTVQVTDGTNTMPTMDVAARAGFQKVTDGTNTAAVKAASTAAVATDPALVVAVSPNNTVAVKGAGTAGSPDTNVVTVQGIASGTAIPVSSTYANFQATVRGPDASGAAPTQNPIVIAGLDASGNVKRPLVDAQGQLQAGITSATPAQSSVAGSATSVQLLASNTARKGCTIFNDSASILFVRLGTTASTSNFTVRMLPNAYYESPFGYTGRIDGIWVSATGNARITEFT